MADLFQKDVRTVNDHVRNIFEEGELREDSVIRKYRITAADRKSYDTLHYNLDVIIAVGYSKFFTGTASERVGVIPEALDFILQQDDGQSRFVQAVTELCLGKSTSTAKLTVARALPG